MFQQSEEDEQTQKRSQSREEVEKMVDATPVSLGDPVATLAAGSVLYSWFNFYVRGDKQTGIFVGLWAPTLLAAASYLQQKDIITRFKKGLDSF
jgi:hypothetical protein